MQARVGIIPTMLPLIARNKADHNRGSFLGKTKNASDRHDWISSWVWSPPSFTVPLIVGLLFHRTRFMPGAPHRRDGAEMMFHGKNRERA